MTVELKSEREIAVMREAGRIVARILHTLAESVHPGMETRELDVIATNELARAGATSSFKNYRPHSGVPPYPATVCVSVNDEIVHGIPGPRVLREGDIVSVDFGAVYRGFHGDAAVTVGVGRISLEAEDLINCCKGALQAGVSAAGPGGRMGDISEAIQSHAESRGYSLVKDYGGHGIGRRMHEDPHVSNLGVAGTGRSLVPGMCLAIEPMVNVGTSATRVGQDKWTVSTVDGKLSAHFESSIAITENGTVVLTAE